MNIKYSCSILNINKQPSWNINQVSMQWWNYYGLAGVGKEFSPNWSEPEVDEGKSWNRKEKINMNL